MAITKLVITGNTTAVGISTTPITVSLEHKAESTSVAAVGNITATNVQAALEQLDDIKVQSSYGTLDNPTFTGTVTFPSAISITDKLGIGINTPLADLHINNVIGSELRIDTTGGTDANSLLNFRESGVDKASLYWDGVDDELYLETTAGDIALMAAGNVGIGTSSPAQALDVNGNIRVQGTFPKIEFHDTDNNPKYTIIGADTSFRIYDETNSTDRMLITSLGNVGIGTSSPEQALHVVGKIRLESNFPTIEFVDTDNNPDFTISGGNGSVGFYDETNGVHRFSVNSSGNVGINTTNPDALLHVLGGDVKISSDSDTSNGDGKPAILFTETIADQVDAAIVYNGDGADADNNYIGIGCFNIALATEDTLAEQKLATTFNVRRDGNVGIGTTSPAAKLHSVASDTQVAVMAGGDVSDPLYPAFGFDGQIGSNGGRGAGMYLPTDNTLAFSTAGSERMRINSSGNVLVAKTSANFNTVGVELAPAGNINATRISGESINLNRLDDDGAIANFYKDNTTVGSIGSRAGTAVYIESQGSTGKVGLDFDSVIAPRNNGALVSSGVYLGTNTYRFQQLFVNESTSVSSDRRLKENIADADDAGSTIDSVQIRKFDWIENGKHQDYGVIAQEVLEVVPDAVQVPEDEDGRMGVSYETFIPMLIKEIQSLRSRVAELENV